MELTFRAVAEDEPGPKWAGLFAEFWPSYRRWWTRESTLARPTYRACLNAVERHMPEMAPLYRTLCAKAGGGDEQARFLSFWCPPPYLSGCSQAIWSGAEPLMVRNYDYSPHAFDAVVLATRWMGRRVLAMSDGLFGVVDGINDAGLAVSLTFGGRRIAGEGFGVPLILRYVLQLLNHTPLSVTGQRYARPSLDALRPAMTVTCKRLKQRTAGAKRPPSG